ncbi:MAG TPA: hypothetical protein PK773_07990, partial [Aminivibrio sp.]|nr:hypothetical protein [Aminivibrio sp.]
MNELLSSDGFISAGFARKYNRRKKRRVYGKRRIGAIRSFSFRYAGAFSGRAITRDVYKKTPAKTAGAGLSVARRTRFDLVTCGSVDRRSIHLSY